jgi:hypothetical protein
MMFDGGLRPAKNLSNNFQSTKKAFKVFPHPTSSLLAVLRLECFEEKSSLLKTIDLSKFFQFIIDIKYL